MKMESKNNIAKFKILKCIINENKFIHKSDIYEKTKVPIEQINVILKELEKSGYEFSFNPHLGYKLVKVPEEYNPTLIKAGLNTEIIGKQINTYKKVNSTNKKLLANTNSKEGMVLLSEAQFNGKGRRNRKWVSPEGGIYLSILLKSREDRKYIPIFNLIGAISIAESLKELYNLPVSVKWPNDVVLDSKKISGVLSEVDSRSENRMVMGIGINVNIDSKQLPPRSISVKEYLQRSENINKLKLIWELLKNLEEKYFLYKNNKLKNIMEKWKYYSGLLGKQVKIFSGTGEILEGYVNNIDGSSGAMILRTDTGLEKVILEGTVEKI